MNKLNPQQGQQLTKDLLELCEQDKGLLETIMDDYVYKLNDKEALQVDLLHNFHIFVRF